jgi:hypothetical protein
MDHDDALKALHEAARNKDLMKDVQLAAPVLKAIGQHADPRSVEVLADDPFDTSDHAAIQARILGLGNIRAKESIEELLHLMTLTHPGGMHRRLGGFMDEFRLGLVVLTGVDQGLSPELWERWWRENKKTFAVPAELPSLPKPMRTRWENYWGIQRRDRGERREDRGGEPAPR